MEQSSTPLSSYVESWHPSATVEEDTLPPAPATAFRAVLDLPAAAAGSTDVLPPLWHWFYFLSWPRQSELGPDGHLREARFLPPIPGRRRMFAGGRLSVTQPLRLGVPAERHSSLLSVVPKQGRTGELLFVTERQEFRQAGRTCLVEEQDIVYRSGRSDAERHPSAIDTTTPPSADGTWSLALQPDERLLFRVSALTANTHRIHYDLPYCRAEEGYPGLVVHGPLLALLMLELARTHAPDRQVRSLSYRLRRPVFAGEHLTAVGTPGATGAELSIATARDTRHATTEVTFA
jgi:3-methylfumaryl-CoA hydratase